MTPHRSRIIDRSRSVIAGVVALLAVAGSFLALHQHAAAASPFISGPTPDVITEVDFGDDVTWTFELECDAFAWMDLEFDGVDVDSTGSAFYPAGSVDFTLTVPTSPPLPEAPVVLDWKWATEAPDCSMPLVSGSLAVYPLDSDGDGDPDATDPDDDGDGTLDENDPNPLSPMASDDRARIPVGGATRISLLANDDFIAGGPGIAVAQSGVLTASGHVDIVPQTGMLSYTPLAAELGSSLRIGYQVCNYTICATAEATIIVVTANAPPNEEAPTTPVVIARDDEFSAVIGTAINDSLLENDEFETGAETVVSILDEFNGVGDLAVERTTGQLTYVPHHLDIGEDLLFSYRLCQGDTCDTASVLLVVQGDDGNETSGPRDSDSQPTVARDDFQIAYLGDTLLMRLLENDDFSPDADVLVRWVEAPADAADLQLDETSGAVWFTPAHHHIGSPLTWVYRVCSGEVCDDAQLVVTVFAPGAGK